MAGARQQTLEARRRQARRVGAVGFLAAAALPVVLWHDVIAAVGHEFGFDVGHLSGWVPWLLMLAGLAFLAPVAWSAGRDPESRWYPRARAAYAGWGVTLYLLGFLLAFQVARITQAGAGG